MVQSFYENAANERSRIIIEMAVFNEEQHIRHFKGPGFFSELKEEIESGCARLNRLEESVSCISDALSVAVRDIATAHSLHVEYNVEASGIRVECKGKITLIMFQVVKQPAPYVVAVMEETPLRAVELAAILLRKLTK